MFDDEKGINTWLELEKKANYHTGYWLFMQKMATLQYPFDQDWEMEKLYHSCNHTLLYHSEPVASIARGALDALKLFERTKIIPL